MMPIIELPAPSGPYAVGSTNYSVTDGSRDENLTKDPDDKRELFVEIWYPADLDGADEIPGVKPLWQELYIGEVDRISFFMNYLKGIDTHTYPNIPPNVDEGPFPVILFNHGLQMFTAQSTLLMEHLASHGYIVISIAHPYESIRVNLSEAGTVLPGFITNIENFKEAIAWIEKSSAPILAAKDSMKEVQTREQRAEIMLRAIKNSEMNALVSNWEMDNLFIVNQLIETDEQKFAFQKSMDTSRIGIMGMSVGGAVAAEFAKADRRIKAGINVDGLQYGKRNHIGLEVPFMMIYSKDGMGSNDFLLLNSKSDFYEFTLAEARHPDFTDMTLIWPVMRMYGQLGAIPGERMTNLTNDIILNFWNSYLKEKPFKNFNKNDYPELDMTIKLESDE